MTVARSVARSVASPVARAVGAGIGGGLTFSQVVSDAVGYWPLQDDAADTVVINQNGTNGTLAGGNNTEDLSVTGPGGLFSKAIDFDGTADFATQARVTSGALTALTCAAVINAPTAGTARVICGEVDLANNSRQWQLALSSTNQLQFWVNSGGNAATPWRRLDSTTTLTPGDWYWVSATYDGSIGSGDLKLYVNGSSVVSTLGLVGICNAIYNGIAPMRIAASTTTAGAGANFYDGPIAGIAVWDRVLSTDEISVLSL